MGIDWFIIKVANRCNLNCTYCYVFNRGDDSWNELPPILTEDSIELICLRIAEHCRSLSKEQIVVELHGGEPLLLGKVLFEKLIFSLRNYCYPTKVDICLQTNGLLLNEQWLKIFVNHNVSFSVSIDPTYDDVVSARLDKKGNDSTPKLLRKLSELSQLPEFKTTFTGALCVITHKCDPEFVVDWFYQNDIHSFDLLVPDANYSNPDPDTPPEFVKDFMIKAYKRWLEIDDPDFRIRIFQHLIKRILGVESGLDALGGELNGMCVIESDATIHHHDVLKICTNLSTDTLSLYKNSIDDFCRNAPSYLNQSLPTSCLDCEQKEACGGGYLPHRYLNGTFDQPTFYCEAFYELINVIKRSLIGTN